MSTIAPLCFVLMPFGRKTFEGKEIDFDAVYRKVIAPAIADAELEAIRADEETTGGIIHKAMFERLILCPFAVADLTSANPSVFYELGVRHAARSATTVLLFAEGQRVPFDAASLRMLSYRLAGDGTPANAEDSRRQLAARLSEARREHGEGVSDSPVFQLLGDFSPDMQHLRTDVFRNGALYAAQLKEMLAAARKIDGDAIARVETSLGADLDGVESGVLVDLLLSYRAVKAWQRMIDLVGRMPKPLVRTALVQEQLALALNRAGRDDDAERVLNALLFERGPSSETYALLGRIHKDRWTKALRENNPFLAREHLQKAIDQYVRGFEADWRDAYPGINAVTLMEIADPPDPRRREILPVVRYAVKQRLATGKPDYWDFATLLELAILGLDESEANMALSYAVRCVREKWEPETTLEDLDIIHKARTRRGEAEPPWVANVMDALRSAAA